MPMPTSVSLKASISMAENIMLKRVGARTHPCFTPFAHREWLGYLTTVLNSSQHAIMKLLYNGNEFLGASIHCHDSPKAISTYSVKGLGQIDIGGIQVSILLLTLLLELSSSKHHVNSSTFFLEVTLALW